MLASLQSTRASLEASAEAGGEAGVAVSEMQNYAAGVGDGTLAYLETGEIPLP